MSKPVNAFLADVLNRQVELAEDADLAQAAPRLRAYAEGEPWREEDIQLVWTSPGARRLYLRARAAVVERVETGWADRGLARDFLRRAADSAADNEVVMQEAGVTIRVLQAPGSGDWMINVVLSHRAVELLPAGMKIKLVDSGGQEWLQGEPDRAGGVDAFWESTDQTPIERLREHSLSLTFV